MKNGWLRQSWLYANNEGSIGIFEVESLGAAGRP